MTRKERVKTEDGRRKNRKRMNETILFRIIKETIHRLVFISNKH